MTSNELQLIPARKGVGAHVRKGQTIKVVNTNGFQVVDTWAFGTEDPGEFMSMEHCRSTMGRLRPRVGDSMVTNRRRPILTVLEDTTTGVHDMLFAACDIYRYRELGVEGYHDNCTDNLAETMQGLGLDLPETPCPFNMFQNTVPNPASGEFEFRPPEAQPGQHMTLRADMDLVIVFSACPMDVIPLNGPDGSGPQDAHFLIS